MAGGGFVFSATPPSVRPQGAIRTRRASMKLNGAELIIKMLQRHGVSIVAGIPGGASLPLYDALEPERLCVTSSRGTSRARDSSRRGWRARPAARRYASALRVPARPICSPPSPMRNSTRFRSSPSPAQVPRKMIGTDAFQEIDTYGLTIPITKHNFQVRSVGELARGASRCVSDRDFGTAGPGGRRCAQGCADRNYRARCAPRSRATRSPASDRIAMICSARRGTDQLARSVRC